MLYVLERNVCMRRPFQVHRRYSSWKNIQTKTEEIRKQTSLFPNISRSGYSKETYHGDVHLSHQNIFLIKDGHLHYFPPKRMFCVLKRNFSMRRPFEHTKHISARKPPIPLKYALTFCQNVCSVCFKRNVSMRRPF